jgi:hypothetical protein
MSVKDGQFATKEGKSRGTAPQGDQNPLAPVPLGQSPSTPNPSQPGTYDDSTVQPGRYEVFSGQSVAVGEKSATNHPRVAGPDVFDQSDPNQLSRHLTPESTGVRVVKKGEKQ